LPRLAQPITPDGIRRLHRGTIEDPKVVRLLLERLRDRSIELDNGFDGGSNPRTATIEQIGDDRMRLRATPAIRPERQPQIYFHFELEGGAYFFAAPSFPRDEGSPWLEVGLPIAVYQAERRDLPRDRERAPGTQVELSKPGGWKRIVPVVDVSYEGLGVRVPVDDGVPPSGGLEVRFLNGDRAGERAFASLRHHRPASDGWLHLGLSLSQVSRSRPIQVETRDRILGGGTTRAGWRRVVLSWAGASAAPRRVARRVRGLAARPPEVEVVEYQSSEGKPIRALVNRTRDSIGGPAVVIPPSWGRTKETLLPLALTLVRTFEKAGEPLTVIRFDGTHRRGESYVAPRFRQPGDEYLGFTFSQAVRDIHSTLDFVRTSDRVRASRAILCTSSIGSVEGRRALATDSSGLLAGWVALVGMVDLLETLRVASGGINYPHGLEQGVHFGRQELTGVVVDMQVTGPDAMEHRLVYLEDARRDMAAIKVPLTWIFGRYDGWMDLRRVQDLLSSGDGDRRRLLVVPTGHQLRNSRQALETFQLAAHEVARMLLGRDVEPAVPDLVKLEQQRRAERARRPSSQVDLRAFWRDYLVGRDRSIGIELMTATQAYRDLMEVQVEAMSVRDGDRVVDVGAGAGDFAVHLLRRQQRPTRCSITAIDFVHEALARGVERLSREDQGGIAVSPLVADLCVGATSGIPIRATSFDAALASLLLSYVDDPEMLLDALYRVLRPGGRLVASTLIRDADNSLLYAAARDELHPAQLKRIFPAFGEADLETIQRRFVNDNARIFNLEEQGHFRFWDASEFEALISRAGFDVVRTDFSFGTPPQVVVVTARRR
jgi:ubiquinone/menaquinone biosynthesis C-methylase UbiE